MLKLYKFLLLLNFEYSKQFVNIVVSICIKLLNRGFKSKANAKNNFDMHELLKMSFDKSTYESAKSHVDYIIKHDEYCGFDNAMVRISFAYSTIHELLEIDSYSTIDLQRQLFAYVSLLSTQVATCVKWDSQVYPYDIIDDDDNNDDWLSNIVDLSENNDDTLM